MRSAVASPKRAKLSLWLLRQVEKACEPSCLSPPRYTTEIEVVKSFGQFSLVAMKPTLGVVGFSQEHQAGVTPSTP